MKKRLARPLSDPEIRSAAKFTRFRDEFPQILSHLTPYADGISSFLDPTGASIGELSALEFVTRKLANFAVL